MAFSPDGHTLVSGSEPLDGTIPAAIRLWNVTEPAHPVALGYPATTSQYGVNALAVSPDGHGYWLAAQDGRVWNFGSAPYEPGEPSSVPSAPIVALSS